MGEILKNIHKNIPVWIPITIFLLFSSALTAKEITVSLTTDRTSVTTDESFEVLVTIKGIQRLTSYPKFTTSEGFRFQNAGSSSQVKLINGDLSVEKVFRFVFTPQKKGKFTIGPAQIEYGGKVYTSNALTMVISNTPQREQTGKDNRPHGTTDRPRPYFIETTVSNPNPYLQQQIIFTFKLYSRGRILDAKLDLPKFEGFWKEKLGEQREYMTNRDGKQWEVTEIKLALFPTTPGKIEIEETGLNVQVLAPSKRQNRRYQNSIFDSFFNQSFGERKKLRLRARPISVSVKELPTTGKDSNFTGLVGKFQMASSLSKNRLKVGESTTLTLKIQGRGNIRGLKFDDLEFENFKVYQDKPKIKSWHRNDLYYGSHIQDIALVPQESGLQELPPLKFQYFDPESSEYKYLTIPSLPIQVGKALEEEKLNLVESMGGKTVKKKQIKVLGADLMPLKRDVYHQKNQNISVFGYISAFVSIFLMPLAYILTLYLKKRYDLISSDTSLMLKENAYKNFKQGLKKLSTEKDLMANSSSLLRNFIGNKLGIDGMALTPNEAFLKLQDARITKSFAGEVTDFLKTMEMGIYGGVDTTNYKGEKIPDKLSDLVKRLDKELRK